MNAKERADQTMAKMRLTSDGILLNDMALNFLEAHKLLFTEAIEQAIIAAIEADRKSRPHVFVGSLDRYCELCNEPDRHENHLVKREWMTNAVKQEREACAKIADAHARVGREMANREEIFIAEAIANVIRHRSDS